MVRGWGLLWLAGRRSESASGSGRAGSSASSEECVLVGKEGVFHGLVEFAEDPVYGLVVVDAAARFGRQ